MLPGWAVELVLIAALAPFLLTAVDLFARCRRRHIPLTSALRSYRSRLGFWLWVAVLFELFALLGFWPKAPSSPMADRLNAATKFIATHRPESLDWGPFEGFGPDIV